MKNRILVVEELDYSAPSANGILNIIGDFVKFGAGSYQIELVGLGKPQNIGKWTLENINGVNERFFTVGTSKRYLKSRFSQRLPASLLLVFGLLRFAKRLNISGEDFLQVHRIEIGAFASIFLSGRIVQLIHNSRENLTGPNSDSIWKHMPRLYSMLERIALNGAEAVGIFNKSEAMRVSLMKPVAIQCRTWFDQDFFAPLNTRPENEAPKIAWVGRMDEQKNPLLAVRIFKDFASLHTGAELHMFGDGPLLSSVSAEVEKIGASGVFLHGAVPKRQLAESYRACDSLLMTSHYEGSPTVLVEALGSGLPAVTNVASDPDEIIKQGINGFRVTSSSEADFAFALQSALLLSRKIVAKSVENRAANVLCLQTLVALHGLHQG